MFVLLIPSFSSLVKGFQSLWLLYVLNLLPDGLRIWTRHFMSGDGGPTTHLYIVKLRVPELNFLFFDRKETPEMSRLVYPSTCPERPVGD